MNERSIFLQALEKEDPTERSAYLETACGQDTNLRQRVELLLQSHTEAGSFLDISAPQQAGEQAAQDAQAATPDALDQTQTLTSLQSPADVSLDFLAPAKRPGSLGRLGHYEVLEVVGRGGFGVVLRAFDEKLHRVVAVKVMAREFASNGEARKRFIREARTAAAVNHDNVVAIHAVEDGGSLPYLVMQFVDGRSLQQKIAAEGSLELKQILRIGSQIAAGLAAAHKQGHVHRDIKPANVLLENGVERVKITDFGLARAVDDASVSRSGVIAGTPQYMSPEQAEGKPVDHRSDLFSLGSVLYAMCTGRAPFRAESTMATLRRVCDDTPRPIRELNPDIPEWLCEIIAKLHAKNPAERYQTAKEVAGLLEERLANVQQPDHIPIQSELVPEGMKPFQVQHHADWTRAILGWPLFLILLPFLVAIVTSLIAEAALLDAWLPTFLTIVTAAFCVPLGVVLVAMRLARQAQGAVHGASADRPTKASTRRWLLAGAAALLVAGLFWFFPSFTAWVTGKAVLQIETQRDVLVTYQNDVKVLVFRQGKKVAEIAAGDWLSLEPDWYQLFPEGCFQHAQGDKWVMEIEPRELWLGPGKKTVARIFVRRAREGDAMAVIQKPAAKDAGFVPLFNGKDLTGWKTHPEQPGRWTVEGGSIVGRGPVTSHLFTERNDYQDFILRVEVRSNAASDSGVLVRCGARNGPNGTPVGYEVNIAAEETGDIYDTAVKWGEKGGGRLAGVGNSDLKHDTWGTLELIARGNRITALVNGKLVADYSDERSKHRKGHVALQVHGGNALGTVVEFRKIEIKELPATRLPDTAEQVLPALAGTWKGEFTQRIYGGKPAEKKFNAISVNDWIVGNKWLRQRVHMEGGGYLSLTSFEPGSQTFRDWFFHASGLIFGPSAGRWDPATRSITWTSLPQNGILMLNTWRFVDADTVHWEAMIRDKEGQTIFQMDAHLERSTETATIDETTAAGPLPPEMTVLDRLVGDWQTSAVIKNASNPDGFKASWLSSSRRILGGRVITTERTGSDGEDESISLATFDTFSNAYGRWSFRANGNVMEYGGRWDEKNQTLKWHWAGKDGSQSSNTWPLHDPNRRDWQVVTKDALGKTTYEVQATSVRKVEINELAPVAGKAFVGWGEVVDPAGDCRVILEKDRLSVTVPATPHDLKINSNAPRVLQKVEGDFVLQTKVGPLTRPAPRTSTTGIFSYVGAGLLVWSEKGHYLRLERAAVGEVKDGEPLVVYESARNGKVQGSNATQISAATAWLQIERRGGTLYLRHSPDGQAWTLYQTISDLALPTRVQVGVAALNTAKQACTFMFEGFKLDSLPATGPSAKPATKATPELDQLVELARKQRDLAVERVKAGTASVDEQILANIALVEAKLRRAVAKADLSEQEELLGELVAQRQKRLEFTKLRVEAGREPPQALTETTRDFVEAQLRHKEALARLGRTPLDARWIHVSAEYQGKQVSLEESKDTYPSEMLIKGDQYGLTWAGKQHEGGLRIDATKTPAEIDFTGSVFASLQPRKAIYELDGDRLRLCMAFVGPNADPPRPTSFKTDPGSKNVVLSYRREASAPPKGDAESKKP